MLKMLSILLIAAISGLSPAASKDWSHGMGCGFANLGGCRRSIKIGEPFTAPRAYIFREPSDLDAWRSKSKESRAGQGNDKVLLKEARGIVAIEANTIMIAKEHLQPCCPGSAFEGVVEHPEFGEVYIVDPGRF